jgi:hypothetical protein
MLGIVSTPTWGHNIEDFWGYRSLEKTPLDLYKLGSSRDFGFGIKGAFDEAKTVNYFFLYGNGASNKGETDKHKKLYGSLAIKPTKGVLIEAYADYEAKPDDKKYYILQGFGGYEDAWGRIGIQWARRHYEHGDSDYDYDVFSGFAVVKAAKDVDIIGRFDHMRGDGFESSFKGTGISYLPFANNPGAPFNLIIGAISYSPVKNVWLIPNIKYVFYGDPEEGEKPGEDVYANLTVWYKF